MVARRKRIGDAPMTRARRRETAALRVRNPDRKLTDGALATPQDTALAAFQAGQFDTAEALCREILETVPEDPAALHILGMIAARRGRHGDAIPLFHRVLALCPAYAPGHRNLGTSLQASGDLAGATKAFRRALAIDPRDIDALNNLGTALKNAGDTDGAIDCFEQALAISPNHPAVCYNLGRALSASRDLPRAITCYRHTLKAVPEFLPARLAQLSAQHKICDWHRLETLKMEADRLIRAYAKKGADVLEEPLSNVRRSDDPHLNFLVASAVSRHLAKAAMVQGGSLCRDAGSKRTGERLRIGYLCGNVRDHPTMFLLRGVLARHDRTRFRIHFYASGPDDGSPWRRWVAGRSERFVDLRGQSQAGAAATIAADDLDILIDLDGHTEGGRLDIAAFRPAAINVSYLGFPGTTGARFMDYIIVDRTVFTKDAARFFSEKPVFLTPTYAPTDTTQEVSSKPCRRTDHGLPLGEVVFCSFNQAEKLEPVMFDTWLRILRRVPGSVLWLADVNEYARKNLKAYTRARGIATNHIVFAPRLPRDEHLGRLALADLALDTRIYNGHTTTQDALYMGVPVITLRGRHFASRVAASLLGAIGMAELITESLEAYEDLAVGLATDHNRRAALRTALSANRATHPLFDTTRYVRNLERAYTEIVRLHREGRAPEPIILE